MLVAFSGVALAAPTVPGAVYSDQQATGSNKPVEQIQQDLQKAGIKDVPPDAYFAGSITVLVEAGLLKPDADGNVHPEAETDNFVGISVFAKVLGIAAKNDDPVTALYKMKSAGLVSDFTTGDTQMNRLDAARMLALALGVEPKVIVNPANYPFKDFGALHNNYDLGILAALYDLGVFKGYEDGTFRPEDILTTAQLAILVDRVLGSTR
jgi:hypothetical protein